MTEERDVREREREKRERERNLFFFVFALVSTPFLFSFCRLTVAWSGV